MGSFAQHSDFQRAGFIKLADTHDICYIPERNPEREIQKNSADHHYAAKFYKLGYRFFARLFNFFRQRRRK